VLFSTINANGSNAPDIGLLNLKDRTRQRMINGGSFPEYSDGHILFTRNNSLFVTSFDPHKSLGNSQEILLIKNIMNNMNGSAQYAVGGSTLIYLKTNESAEQEYIAWVDRSGKIDTIFSNGRPFFQPTLAPDGNSVAVTNIDGTNQDIHLFNFDSKQFSRITSHPGEDFNPLWSPDGKEMIFGSEIAEDAGESGPGMARISIDSDKLPESLVRSPGFGNWEFPTSWSGDGKWLLFTFTKGAPIGDVEALNLETNERKIIAAQTTVDEGAAVFSPDGKWVAYVSNFSGRDEVYVKAFYESTSARQVSVSGGYEPLWSKDGGELFYREKDKMMSISILDQTTMEMSIPKMLFQGPFKDNQGGGDRYNYDVSEDGKRFIMIYRHNMPKPEIIHVVLNWKGLMEQ
jgi:Tol biopolymer transport system component